MSDGVLGADDDLVPPSPPPGGVAVPKQGGCLEAPLADSTPDTLRFARYGLARLVDQHGELRAFAAIEEEVNPLAICHSSGRMSEVARRLRIGRSTLYRKLRGYGIEPEAGRRRLE